MKKRMYVQEVALETNHLGLLFNFLVNCDPLLQTDHSFTPLN